MWEEGDNGGMAGWRDGGGEGASFFEQRANRGGREKCQRVCRNIAFFFLFEILNRHKSCHE